MTAAASEQLKVARYRVRRWTVFEWTYPAGQGDSRAGRSRVEDHLERSASIIEHKLLDTVPRMEPSVKGVRIDGQPQLLFQITVLATDENDARQRAMYRFGRGLTAKIPTGKGRRQQGSQYARGRTNVVTLTDTVTLSPPWGRFEVVEIDDG